MNYAFNPASQVTLPVRGTTDLFPLHRIYCVGRNYAAHAVEMGHNPDKELPFFFQKNPDNIVLQGDDFPYPSMTEDVHHEIELTVALKTGGDRIATDTALDCVYGYGVALDMTRRDLQADMKKAGRPWEVGKAFENSAPSSGLVRADEIGHPESGAIWLKINDQMRQEGDINQMIWKVPEIISILSRLFTLRPGDLIMTGTPSGVGPVSHGDELHGFIENVGELTMSVV